MKNKKFITVNVSNRHIHLTREHVEALFGEGYRLSVKKVLMQPQQFSANEVVDVLGPKAALENVRIVGPERIQTQVEITAAEARKIGVETFVRLSGDLKGTAGVILKSAKGAVELKEGCIVAKRHLHFPPRDAAEMKLKNGDVVSVKVSGERALSFENMVVRIDEKNAEIECHLDIDEANAALIKSGDKVEIIK
ncbi:MAG: phosphate propanoyltransferase [Endomicrobium sp.]|jgi:putative phosphotransacetylase|nr:phosphate propanoyltransferase [Endomicrobium sp.]